MNKIRLKPITKLLSERKKLVNQLPKMDEILRATISKNFLTCGTKGCHCHLKDGKKHGPYYYLSYIKDKKLKTFYIPKKLRKKVKINVKNYNKFWKLLCEICDINRQMLWKEEKNKSVK